MKWAIAIFAIAGTCGAFAQGAFQDLNFEDAAIVPVAGGISEASAFPGWQASFNIVPTSVVGLDGATLGGAEIELADGTWPLQGNYSAYLFGGGFAPNLYSASLSQTATVPVGTESIQFDGNVSGAPFVVTLGGTPIQMVPLQADINYELWGGNIPPSMAGQAETLTFREPPATDIQPSMFELDDIVFSPTVVTTTPEPDPIVLMGIGGALFAAYRRFAPKRK